MLVPNLPMHEGLLVRSRLRAAGAPLAQIRLWELATLVAMGVLAAAAATFWDMSLRIPGHAILRVVFPMTLGLALVPRRGSGLVMGGSALGATLLLSSAGHGAPGAGAMTSLALTGPLLDLALWRAKQGWTLYGGFAVAGLVSNLTAFAVRGGARLAGVARSGSGMGRGGGLGSGMGGGGGLGRGGGLNSGMGGGGDPWWLVAPLSYVLCGLLAGLLCAAIWFAARPRRSSASRSSASRSSASRCSASRCSASRPTASKGTAATGNGPANGGRQR